MQRKFSTDILRSIEEIQHTADKGIRVKADSMEELFTAALEGMARIQKRDSRPINETHKDEINIQAPDATALLIDFLSEVHTLSDIHNFLFHSLEIQSLTETRLQGLISGIKVDGFDEDIKAVTHSQADIHKTEEGLLETIIVFDM